MDTVFLSFANQQNDLLSTLQEEDDALNRLLAPRAKAQHFLLHRESFATLEKLASALTMHRDELVLFLFSGHAGRDALLLGDGRADALGIARMLGQCPQLKLVFLNGCSTQGQVAQLLAAGVPVVLATSAPVSDRKAAFFSTRFFEALAQQFTLHDAFQMASGALEAGFPGLQPGQHRDVDTGEAAAAEPAWGLFCKDENEHLLDWKLPIQGGPEQDMASYVPNQHLIEVLFAALGQFNSDIEKMQQQEKRGMQVSLPKKRMAVLNALPAPLAEPLRKLMVPVDKENEGYDKVSEARLRQIVDAYAISMELFCYTLLAQIWDAYYQQGQLKITDEQREVLRGFFRLGRTARETFDFLPFAQTLREILVSNSLKYFVEELGALGEQLQTDAALQTALRFLSGLRVQVRSNKLDKSATGYQCRLGEESLAYLYSQLGFLARYKLATIQGIDVLKYRHRREARFNHAAVMLHDLLGGFDLSELNLDHSLDNRSILLINEETWEYLNLSPFVVDENAFQERTEICKLYFFSHYVKNAGVFCFTYVNKPDDPYLEISDQRYPLVKEQFDAFATLILQQPLNAV